MVTGMEKPYVVGMDIGGTNTVFGIVDSRGNVLATDSVKTQSFSKIVDPTGISACFLLLGVILCSVFSNIDRILSNEG